jgi:hypothetical protein
MADNPKFAAKDIPFALSTLIQALVYQLMESGALTVEQGQRVFDAAAKRAAKAKGGPGDAVRLIEHLSEQMQCSPSRGNGQYLGTVEGPNEKAAEAAAVAEFDLSDEQRRRLVVQERN